MRTIEAHNPGQDLLDFKTPGADYELRYNVT